MKCERFEDSFRDKGGDPCSKGRYEWWVAQIEPSQDARGEIAEVISTPPGGASRQGQRK